MKRFQIATIVLLTALSSSVALAAGPHMAARGRSGGAPRMMPFNPAFSNPAFSNPAFNNMVNANLATRFAMAQANLNSMPGSNSFANTVAANNASLVSNALVTNSLLAASGFPTRNNTLLTRSTQFTSSSGPRSRTITSRFTNSTNSSVSNNGQGPLLSLTTPNLCTSGFVTPGFYANASGNFYPGTYNGWGGYPVLPGNAMASALSGPALNNVLANLPGYYYNFGNSGLGYSSYGGANYPSTVNPNSPYYYGYYGAASGLINPGFGYGYGGAVYPNFSTPAATSIFGPTDAAITDPFVGFAGPNQDAGVAGVDATQAALASNDSSHPDARLVAENLSGRTSSYDNAANTNTFVNLSYARSPSRNNHYVKNAAIAAVNNPINRPTPGRSAALVRQLITYGDEHFGKKEYLDANDRYRSAARQPANVADAWFRQGFAWAAVGKYDYAAQAFRRGLHMNPNWAWTDFQLSDLYGQDTQEKREKIDDMISLSESQPTNADAAFVTAIHLYFDGRPDKAAPFFRRAAEIFGSSDDVQGFLAQQ